uniref:Plexin b1b n=1 Tax=Gadus morhua TaxID=8049 RepID=A0A8C5AG44_GADMO
MVQRTAGALGPLSVLLLAATVASALTPPPYPSFSRNDTLFEHLALHPDPSVGRVYVGGRDRLYQLDRALALELQDDTGPVTDSRECLPPVTQGNCPQARLTPNHNKLLLVDPYSMELIACGSVNQGICQKRSLVNISAVLFSAQRPVDTQYVAANDPEVSTVGLVVRSRPERQPVLYVGRGYTSSHPPISTRNLQQEPVFSYEETAKLAVAGRLSEYDHHFVASFARRRHVYFLFYRRDLKSLSREYRSYVSRVCLDDQAYYSYVEVPLTCRSGAGKVYNLLQAVRLGGAKPGSEVLLGVFSTRLASSAQPSDDSALCTFRLVELERRINATRDLCYTQSGREAGGDAAYIEYDVKSNCANLPENTLEAYPCGSDHTPSPMASRTPVVAETILHSPSARLTAVAVSVRDDHTIAFLGDSKGNLHKVYLGPNGEVEEYAVVPVQPNTPISSDLILDQKEEHLFIMTSTMLQKRPVAECHIHTDCDSCLQGHDPYCGWCVLEGSCALQSQCKRSNKTGQWLWSFDMEQQCLSVQDLQPSNVSRDQSRMVSIALSVPGLPGLGEGEGYSCLFQDGSSTAATTTPTGVTCRSPDPSRVPMNITTLLCPLYDTSNHSLSPRCHGCVESRWGCNWCVHQHLCTYKSSCEEGVVIYNQHFKLPTSAPPTNRPPPVPPTLPAVPATTSTTSTATSTTSTTSTTTPTTTPTTTSTTPTTTATTPVTTPIAPTTATQAPPTPTTTGPTLGPTTPAPPTTLEPAAPAQTTAAPPDVVPLATVPTAPPSAPDPESHLVPPEKDTATRGPAVVPTGVGSEEPATTPSPAAVVMETELEAELEPITGAAPAEEAQQGPGDEGSYVSVGPSACPCVEKVQGSSLLPVQVERKITLLAHNLHLYQDKEYQCVLVIEGQTVVVDAYVETDEFNSSIFYITCQQHKVSKLHPDLGVTITDRPALSNHSRSLPSVTLYNCSAGRADCSRCHTVDRKYDCVWCGGRRASCLYSESCGSEAVQQTCPAPLIHKIEPLSGLLEGGTQVTIWGSNLGQKAEDVLHTVRVVSVPCTVIPGLYQISTRIVCKTQASGGEKVGQVSVEVSGGERGLSSQMFSYQDPFVMGVSPERGPKAGGTALTITGRRLLTGRPSGLTITVGGVPCSINRSGEQRVTLHYGASQRHLHTSLYRYTPNPNVTRAAPASSFLKYAPRVCVCVWGYQRCRCVDPLAKMRRVNGCLADRGTRSSFLPATLLDIGPQTSCFTERCEVNSSSLILCRSPAVDESVWGSEVTVEFLLDNLRFPFSGLSAQLFHYQPNPLLHSLNRQEPLKAYRYNPGSFIQLEGENLDLAITKEEVVVLVGEGVCAVKTLTRNHLYCEPPPQQPGPGPNGKKREGSDSLPDFTVQMGNLNFSLGKVQYDTMSLATFPMEARIGVGVGASIVALIVFIIVLIYRRKSKQALRDYKKVQIQLENLETSVRDRCKKEFTDLMTEMMDMSSDLVGSGIPFLDYKKYAERIFFPGHRESPLRRDLDVQECRRQTVEQGLVQLSNLLNSKLFLTKFIHTLEGQRTFSPRDRAYVASLLTVALHGKLEYFTDILKTLLNDLVEQYVAKNPKLMLRRTETVVEKLLTNWMSICLYAFLRDSAGESLYMLFRAIKHQVDKGPVDAVTGKAKYTLNDNRLLREDVEYKTLNLNVLTQGGGVNESQPLPSKVLDIDTISQVKEKLLEQVYKGTTYSQRPHVDSLDLEWRSGVAGHLILSDEDLTSVVQGNWKRLNTLQHYKVPDGATVVLVPRHSKHIHHDNHDYVAGEKTPMLEDADEGGVRLWHLVKAGEEPELPKHRRGSLRERERAKAIPEIYLTRLLSMKGTLQKFVDDLFTVILSTSRPVPLAVKYFFDLLDDQAAHHGITDPETIHIWKTNSLPLRFWINIVKNPQFIFDVQASDHVDAVLSVIAQTFMDSCTVAEHKLGRDSPINKLLYARDIPRYKQMVERYYADIRQTISASDQEMNSALAELSRVSRTIITALEEDPTAQKMQLGYRLQQIAAAVENKVTDL